MAIYNPDKLIIVKGNDTYEISTSPEMAATVELMAKLSEGDTHNAISENELVYIYEHNTLSDGLYKATTNIAANDSLTSSNVELVSNGGLNNILTTVDEIKANKIDTVLSTTLRNSSSNTGTKGTASVGYGIGNTASGDYSQSFGSNNESSGGNSFSSGYSTIASGLNSSSFGAGTTANHKSQHVAGEYNSIDSSSNNATARGNYVEIIGNGTSTLTRSNARSLDWDGNECIKGDLYINCNSDSSGGKAVSSMIISMSSAINIPAAGESISYNLSSLTSSHILHSWNFSSSSENSPPVNLTWATYSGYFTITNVSGTTDETIKPVFCLPFNKTSSLHS